MIVGPNYLKVKTIIAGPEYREKLSELTGESFPTEKCSTKLLRVVVVSKKSAEQLELERKLEGMSDEEKSQLTTYKGSSPIIYSIPPSKLLKNTQPIQIIQLDHSS